MKRGQPLERRTPLAPGRPLQSRSELRRGGLLQRGGPLNPVSDKRRQQKPARLEAEYALGMTPLRFGRCAFCKQWTIVAGHERLRRAQGGDATRPDCLLCDPDNEWAARHGKACEWGWSICRKHPRSPLLAADEAYDIDGNVVRFGQVAA